MLATPAVNAVLATVVPVMVPPPGEAVAPPLAFQALTVLALAKLLL